MCLIFPTKVTINTIASSMGNRIVAVHKLLLGNDLWITFTGLAGPIINWCYSYGTIWNFQRTQQRPNQFQLQSLILVESKQGSRQVCLSWCPKSKNLNISGSSGKCSSRFPAIFPEFSSGTPDPIPETATAFSSFLSYSPSECTKIARFSAVAAAIFTAPTQNRAIFKAPRCAISSAKKIASERRFSLRLKGKLWFPLRNSLRYLSLRRKSLANGDARFWCTQFPIDSSWITRTFLFSINFGKWHLHVFCFRNEFPGCSLFLGGNFPGCIDFLVITLTLLHISQIYFYKTILALFNFWGISNGIQPPRTWITIQEVVFGRAHA